MLQYMLHYVLLLVWQTHKMSNEFLNTSVSTQLFPLLHSLRWYFVGDRFCYLKITNGSTWLMWRKETDGQKGSSIIVDLRWSLAPGLLKKLSRQKSVSLLLESSLGWWPRLLKDVVPRLSTHTFNSPITLGFKDFGLTVWSCGLRYVFTNDTICCDIRLYCDRFLMIVNRLDDKISMRTCL